MFPAEVSVEAAVTVEVFVLATDPAASSTVLTALLRSLLNRSRLLAAFPIRTFLAVSNVID
jgi:hypothetical protein